MKKKTKNNEFEDAMKFAELMEKEHEASKKKEHILQEKLKKKLKK